MIRVDNDFMMEVGLGEMPEAEAQAFKEHAEEELEVRVGQKIGEGLSDEQLNEFAEITDAGEARQWLETNAPGFREIVLEVFREFKEEISGARAEILG